MKNKMPGTIGKFVWHDLRTSDPERAQVFYAELFGWTFRGDASYAHIHNVGRDQGGIVPLEAGAPSGSNWTAYVSVDDVDATVERAQALGGKTLMPVVDVPTVGRFTLLADPQGAILSPFEYSVVEKAAPRAGRNPHGDFCWDELLTTEPESACAFYGEIFGWKHTRLDMGPMGAYWIQKTSTQEVGGIMKLPRGAPEKACWLPYVAVDVVDATARRVEKLGGVVHTPPSDIPSVGRFSVIVDPTGASVAIYKKL
jgi:uncharacterized protein